MSMGRFVVVESFFLIHILMKTGLYVDMFFLSSMSINKTVMISPTISIIKEVSDGG